MEVWQTLLSRLGLVEFGWATYSVVGQKRAYLIVHIMDLEITIAAIGKM